jgi:pyrroloquinoline quinone (PQQ) biosynthesis protein C
MEWISGVEWEQLGIGTASLLVLVIVVKIMRSQTDKLLRHTETTTDKVLEFFGNHMTENVRQSAETSEVLRGLADAVRANTASTDALTRQTERKE